MFIFYTSDIPRSGPNCTDIIFADDITQIIENFNNDKAKLAEDTVKEVERTNKYENKWKIKTNITKFKLMSVSKLKPAQVEIENRQINFANECSILGLKLKRTGTVSHLTERIHKAKTQTQKLKRFINLETKTKMHLYKALVRPILEYPVIPNALASNTQMSNMQKIQNRNLRIINKNDNNDSTTMKQLHDHYNIEPINTRLFKAAQKLWNKFQKEEADIYEKSTMENRNPIRDHTWWPRTALRVEIGEPPPIYT